MNSISVITGMDARCATVNNRLTPILKRKYRDLLTENI